MSYGSNLLNIEMLGNFLQLFISVACIGGISHDSPNFTSVISNSICNLMWKTFMKYAKLFSRVHMGVIVATLRLTRKWEAPRR